MAQARQETLQRRLQVLDTTLYELDHLAAGKVPPPPSPAPSYLSLLYPISPCLSLRPSSHAALAPMRARRPSSSGSRAKRSSSGAARPQREPPPKVCSVRSFSSPAPHDALPSSRAHGACLQRKPTASRQSSCCKAPLRPQPDRESPGLWYYVLAFPPVQHNTVLQHLLGSVVASTLADQPLGAVLPPTPTRFRVRAPLCQTRPAPANQRPRWRTLSPPSYQRLQGAMMTSQNSSWMDALLAKTRRRA
jgi:hypothetical protein